MNTSRIRVAIASSALITSVGLTAGLGGEAAHAGKTEPIIARGRCTGGGTWKLKAKHDDGRIEMEFEVDVNRNGQLWSVRVKDNGVQVFAGQRTTKAPSGSFSVERRVANRPGADKFTAVATRGGRTCSGTVTLP